MLLFLTVPLPAPQIALAAPAIQAPAPKAVTKAVKAAAKIKPKTPAAKPSVAATGIIPNVPFFSQFRDIEAEEWREVGCGITSLAMMIDFYKPAAVSVNGLLKEAVAAGAYDANAGWTYKGLIQVSKRHGLTGNYHDLTELSTAAALRKLLSLLKAGPVMLPVHNKFDPASTVPHIVVIDGVKNGTAYYNDPAAKSGRKKISVEDLLKGWTQKILVFRPVPKGGSDNKLTLK